MDLSQPLVAPETQVISNNFVFNQINENPTYEKLN